MEKIDLNAPAFGPDAQVIEPQAEESQSSVSQPNESEEVVVEPEASEEEQKVPYGRFKKFHDLAEQATHELEVERARADALELALQGRSNVTEDKLPEWWVKLYGDSEASMEAWQVQSEQNESFKAQVREEAISTIREEQQKESVRVSENINTIDDNIEALASALGRDLSEKEQSVLLDVVDEYTLKDDDGNYLGPPISFDKAWEIVQLKQKVAGEPTQRARTNVASIIGSQTSGEPTAEEVEKNKNFNPLDWGAYRRRL